jgi:tRNA pseudouridine32 synthase / 23S rRNA pseudouridine746 synthase
VNTAQAAINNIAKQDRHFSVHYADEHLVVVDKPAGMLTVPGRGSDKQDCLWLRVSEPFASALVVHRLDMGTSGLCVFALSASVQTALGKAFAARQVRKRYVAVVAGQPAVPDTTSAWQLIDMPLCADWPRRPLQKIDWVDGKPSQTQWRIATSNSALWPAATRLDLAPITGRSHQLRVHLLAVGHPILGDSLYAPLPVQQAAPRMLLHASGLAFAHPVSGQAMHFESPPPF